MSPFNKKQFKWYSEKLKNMIFEKKRLHKLFKSTNDRSYYIDFSKLRALCKIESKLSYNSYINTIQSNLSHNPKSFWNYIKKIKEQ